LSILSTIEQRFGLTPLNSFDANASTLANDFQTTAHVSIGSAYVQPDANNPGKFALIVQGTEGTDHITVTQVNGGIEVQIDGGGAKFDKTFAQSISRIEVYTQGGNDHVQIDNAITVPAFVFTGDGNDHVQAGGGSTVVVGGHGNDQLIGG